MILAIQNKFKLFRQYCQHQKVVILADVESFVQQILMIKDASGDVNQKDFRVFVILVLIYYAAGCWRIQGGTYDDY